MAGAEELVVANEEINKQDITDGKLTIKKSTGKKLIGRELTGWKVINMWELTGRKLTI